MSPSPRLNPQCHYLTPTPPVSPCAGDWEAGATRGAYYPWIFGSSSLLVYDRASIFSRATSEQRLGPCCYCDPWGIHSHYPLSIRHQEKPISALGASATRWTLMWGPISLSNGSLVTQLRVKLSIRSCYARYCTQCYLWNFRCHHLRFWLTSQRQSKSYCPC